MDVTDPETVRGYPDAGAVNSWGQRLRTYRRARLGLSRGDFAEMINDRARRDSINVACSERHVARWELGEVRRPSKTYRGLLAVLGAPVPEIDSVPSARDHGVGIARETVSQSPDFPSAGTRRGANATLLEALATAVVGSADILTPWLPSLDGPESVSDTPQLDLAAVRNAIAGLRAQDQRHGGGSVARKAVDLLKSTTALLAQYRGHTAHAHSLLVATADLARLIGWAHHDIGDQHRARQYATMALVSARRAGADSLVASTLYVLGRISLIERDPRVALRMFQLGQLPAQDAAGGGESARLYANEAWAHAMMGDVGRMRTALSRSEEAIARGADPVEPWTRVFFTPGEFTGMQSVIYNEYALTARGQTAERYTAEAVDAARASLAASTPGRPARSILFDNITVATGAFRLGQIDDAVSFATASLEMTGQVDSRRVGDRLGQLVHTATLASSRSDVRDICQVIRRMIPTDQRTPRSTTRYRLATA
ncbi:helix-turn-helix transcriptional regulator [Nocardia sp. XZ_19_231]|uniref:helix-turn-helix domain-containing protein n=1 Tax=Nocardia sp. XZ_19_231 TaxID=2769252 RepID=UPI00188FBAD8|nr:helix-turn-helix transcriptional regulator [Nocardia sp. XZ_19_231]